MSVTLLTTSLVAMGWLLVMFVPLERAFPARAGQRFMRLGFFTDLCFFFGQYLLFAAAAVWVLGLVMGPLIGWEGLAPLRQAFAAQPWALQILEVVMLGDLCAYWGHRLQHKYEPLWRFHAIHHTTEELDWLAAHREHPLDGLYTQAVVNLPAVLLGFDFSTVMGLVAFRSMWAIFIHANVRVPLGPLHYMFGSPEFHRWHHAKDRDVGNYANLGPWLDVVFGTHHAPPEPPESLGLEEAHPTSYLGLLAAPFLRSAPPAEDLPEKGEVGLDRSETA